MQECHHYLTAPSPPNVTVIVAPSAVVPLLNGLQHAVTNRESPLPRLTPAGHGPQPLRKPPLNPSMVCGNPRFL